MGKLTTAIFNSYVKLPEGVGLFPDPKNHINHRCVSCSHPPSPPVPERSRTVLTAYFGGHTANAQLLHLDDAQLSQEILRQMAEIFSKPLAELQQLLLKSDVRRWDNVPW